MVEKICDRHNPNVTLVVNADGSINVNSTDVKTQVIENNVNGQPVYIGYAAPGSAKDALVWQIRMITYDVNNFVTDVQFASGSNAFSFSWALRGDYEYS